MGNKGFTRKIESVIKVAERTQTLELSESHSPLLEVFPWEALLQRETTKRLERIDLLSCHLTQLPKLIPSFSNLRELRCANNSIPALPEELFSCVELRVLNFNVNKLTELSHNVSKLTNLVELQLANNELETLPEALASLRSLHNLNIDKNYLDFSTLSEPISLMLIALAGQYSNQRSPQEVLPGLFIGSAAAAQNQRRLKHLGITHILAVTPGSASFPTDFTYLTIDIGDTPWEDIKSHFDEAIRFIDRALEKHHGKVLVHCVVGASRSATIIIAYLMFHERMRYTEALAFLKKKRPFVWPNLGFQEQLAAYDKELFPDEYSVASPAQPRSRRPSFAADQSQFGASSSSAVTTGGGRTSRRASIDQGRSRRRSRAMSIDTDHQIILGTPGKNSVLGDDSGDQQRPI